MIEIDPYYANAYFNAGLAYRDLGDSQNAVLQYQKALEVVPDDAEIYYELGNVYYDEQDYQKAVENHSKGS